MSRHFGGFDRFPVIARRWLRERERRRWITTEATMDLNGGDDGSRRRENIDVEREEMDLGVEREEMMVEDKGKVSLDFYTLTTVVFMKMSFDWWYS